MAYERYGQGDDDRRYGRQDQGGRGYRGAGELGGYDRDPSDYGRGDYGQGSYGARGYGQSDDGRSDYGQSDYGQRDYGQRDYRSSGGGRADYGSGSFGQRGEGERYRQGFTGGDDYYRGDQGRGSYASRGQDTYRQSRGTFERQPQRHDQQGGRGFVERAGDEVRSWFGDQEAERRREQDARDAERGQGSFGRDEHYHHWRNQQIQQFDRDYDEYRQENRQKFHNEFSSWRTERQGQRDQLGSVREHQEVVGSDGEHVGTVDKVRGDHVILTKKDQDAGGRHHWIPSRWIRSVDDKVTLTKTAAEAKREWQDAENYGASSLFGGRDDQRQSNEGGANLDRSFSGTY